MCELMGTLPYNISVLVAFCKENNAAIHMSSSKSMLLQGDSPQDLHGQPISQILNSIKVQRRV